MKKQGDLVRLLALDPEFIIDLKYATEDNFTKQKIYSSGDCYVNRNTARLLIKAKNVFKADGYRVKIWDAYRPISAQRRFFEILPNPLFIGEPPDMSAVNTFRPAHLNGQCVDITLVNRDGRDVDMPTGFDDFSEMTGLICRHIPEALRKNAEYLRFVMESVGFSGYDSEWWHFYDATTPPAPFLDFQL